MKTVLLFLATGFQETEALAQVTICKRTAIDIKTVSVTGEQTVESSNGVVVKADLVMGRDTLPDADMLVLPGGMPGSENLYNCTPLRNLITSHVKAGRPVAAICAAPLVLGRMCLLEGRRATCYPGFEPELTGATPTGATVEVDGQFITGHGPGAAIDFGLAIVAYLMGEAEAKKVAASMVWPY